MPKLSAPLHTLYFPVKPHLTRATVKKKNTKKNVLLQNLKKSAKDVGAKIDW